MKLWIFKVVKKNEHLTSHEIKNFVLAKFKPTLLGFHALFGKIKTKGWGGGDSNPIRFGYKLLKARTSTTGVAIHPFITTQTIVYIKKHIMFDFFNTTSASYSTSRLSLLLSHFFSIFSVKYISLISQPFLMK